MFYLVDDHGETLGKFDVREAAVAALDELVAGEPMALEECVVIELDENGQRVGEPISAAVLH